MIFTATIDKFTMNYCRYGNGKRNFVFIPGLSIRPLSLLGDNFAAYFKDFTDEFTVYMFDRISNMPEGYTTEEMAEDTVTVMKQLGIEKACIFGHSQGGQIAQLIALNHPETVEKLVLGQSSSRPNATTTEVIGRWIEIAGSGDADGLNADMIYKVYSPGFIEMYRDALLGTMGDISREDLQQFVIAAAPIISFDAYDRLDEITCPTLVIGCGGDRVLSYAASIEMADRLGCESYMYDEAHSHGATDEDPGYFPRIYSFVTDKRRYAYFAGGCFWCITPTFAETPGVNSVTAGYSGGDEVNPCYEDVKHQKTHHRETVRIEYDPAKVSYKQLLEVFLGSVDPFDGEGQFIDKGFSYTLAVYYRDDEEKQAAEAAVTALEERLGKKPCIAIERYKAFYDAEEYHQNYYLKNPEAFEREMIESGRKKL